MAEKKKPSPIRGRLMPLLEKKPGVWRWPKLLAEVIESSANAVENCLLTLETEGVVEAKLAIYSSAPGKMTYKRAYRLKAA